MLTIVTVGRASNGAPSNGDDAVFVLIVARPYLPAGLDAESIVMPAAGWQRTADVLRNARG